MLTLYGSKGAGSAAIECALRHCRLEYGVVRAATWEEDSARPELAQKNPLGQTRRQLDRHWEIFADIFAATPFLGGDKPGALDYVAAVVTHWSGTRRHLATARPAFMETLRRIEADPLVAGVFAAHWDSR